MSDIKFHEFGTGDSDGPILQASGSRHYFEKPLTVLSGDSLQTYANGDVELIRDGKVVDTTRWVTEKPDDWMTDPIPDFTAIT